jgi:hypothetical protein
MNKSIVLNICGVKSLGGLKIAENAIKSVNESQFDLILLHNNNLPVNTSDTVDFVEIETDLHRFFHPFLNIFLGEKEISLINKSDAIIHLGNFGFKTKNKSFVMIQNILPFEKKDFKNIVLRYFVNKSFKQSDYVIYQLDHVTESIKKHFHNKLIGIGEIKKSLKNLNPQVGIISIISSIRNKNSTFLQNVLDEVSNANPDIKITKITSEEANKDVTSKNFLQSLKEHSIYFHASFYETVGLPLYEASSNGLFVVGPDKNYMNYFDNGNSAKYSENNVSSAVLQIQKILEAKHKNYESLFYIENWNRVLEII